MVLLAVRAFQYNVFDVLLPLNHVRDELRFFLDARYIPFRECLETAPDEADSMLNTNISGA